MKKTRLDALMFERGLAPSRERAKALIMAGTVFISGRRADKPGTQIPEDTEIEVRGGMKFVSRGGYKLERALDVFGIDVRGKICADLGASTGGFTDCLLQRDAKRVYAVDVGYGQLAWKLRTDARVVTMERVNARGVSPEMFAEAPDLVCADVSFISLKLILPAVRSVLKANGEAVCLIKPQFEAGKGQVGKNGVVRDAGIHAEVLDAFVEYAAANGFNTAGLTHSPIKGPEGNIEFLGWLNSGGVSETDTPAIVKTAHEALKNNTKE